MTGSSAGPWTGKRKLPRYLVDAVTAIDCLRDQHTLHQMMREFSGPTLIALDRSVTISARAAVVALLEDLATQHAGLAFLIQELELREGNSPDIRELRLDYACWEVDLLSRADWQELFDLLDGLHLADLPRRYADFLSATGRPLPRIDCTEPWVAFVHAALFNAGPDGSTPCFQVLAHLIALGASGEQQVRIVKWAQEHDPHLGGRTLPVTPTAPPDPAVWRPENYLIVRLKELAQPDRHGHDLLLSHWLRVAPSGPQRRRDRRISIHRAENEVRDLLRAVEAEWSVTLRGELAIEFVLPCELLDLHVEGWRKSPFRGASARLGEDHDLVIRSLDRWDRRDLHGWWGRRWTSFTTGSAGRAHMFAEDRKVQLRADLTRSIAVLSSAPRGDPADATAAQAADELSEALLAGFPIVLWDRRDGQDPAFRAALVDLLAEQDPRELPTLVRKLRIAAEEQADRAVLGHRLALLWDDPERMPSARTAAAPDPRS